MFSKLCLYYRLEYFAFCCYIILNSVIIIVLTTQDNEIVFCNFFYCDKICSSCLCYTQFILSSPPKCVNYSIAYGAWQNGIKYDLHIFSFIVTFYCFIASVCDMFNRCVKDRDAKVAFLVRAIRSLRETTLRRAKENQMPAAKGQDLNSRNSSSAVLWYYFRFRPSNVK